MNNKSGLGRRRKEIYCSLTGWNFVYQFAASHYAHWTIPARLDCRPYYMHKYRGADKSLDRPRRNKLWSMLGSRAISTTSRRELSSSFFFPAKQDAERNSRHSDRNISLFPPWSGQGLLSALVNELYTEYVSKYRALEAGCVTERTWEPCVAFLHRFS